MLMEGRVKGRAQPIETNGRAQMDSNLIVVVSGNAVGVGVCSCSCSWERHDVCFEFLGGRKIPVLSIHF